MTAAELSRGLLAALVALGSGGCGLILGPACLARQQRAHVATIIGEATPGAPVMLEVDYGTAGSQNDLRITWIGQKDAGGPRLRIFATRTECRAFDPAANFTPGSACSWVGDIGSFIGPEARPCVHARTCSLTPGDLVQASLTISHGRGNPEQLGPSARYKLWIFPDAHQRTTFTIEVTSFYGPDC